MKAERDYKGEHRARQVAMVPELVFEEYLEAADTPTRADLLRERSKLAVHFSSATDEWATPPDLFARIAAEQR